MEKDNFAVTIKKCTKKKMPIIWNMVIAFFSLLRIVLSSGYVYHFLVSAGLDDQWMVKRAYNILAGIWLGDYSDVTLIKSVTYPLLLAFFRALGIPYGIGVGILYVCISYIFVKALRPIISNNYLAGFIYLAVLFSPVGFLTLTSARIYRNSLSHWLALLVISSIIGIYLRRNTEYKRLRKWFLAESFSIMIFWELREDGVWIMSFVVPAMLILFIYWTAHKRKVLKTFLIVCIPFFAIIILELGLSAINYNRYGIFTTNDRTGTYCGKVMSLLYKIDDGKNEDDRIWVSNDAIKLARNVSPTLDSFGDVIDESRKFWMLPTSYGADVPGDHSEWALRQAVLEIGYYKDARTTNDFYKSIYQELKKGFEDGRLKEKKGISLSSQMRPFTFEDIKESFKLSKKVVIKYANYDSTGVYISYTAEGMDEFDKGLFENLLLTNIIDYDENHEVDIENRGDYASAHYSSFIIGLLNRIWKLYKKVVVFLNYLSLGAIIFMFISMIFEIRRKEYYSFYAFLLTMGMVLVLIFYTMVICLWGAWMTKDAESSMYWFYGSPGPMLAQVCRILCLTYLYNRIVSIVKKQRQGELYGDI